MLRCFHDSYYPVKMLLLVDSLLYFFSSPLVLLVYESKATLVYVD